MVILGGWGLFGQIGNSTIEINEPTWEKVNTPNEGPNLSKFAEANGRMWTLEKNGRLYYSDNNGQDWQIHPQSNLNNQQIFAGDFGIMLTRLAQYGEFTTYSAYHDIYLSQDNGDSFTKSDASFLVYCPSTNGTTTSYGAYKKSSNELIEISKYEGWGGVTFGVRNSLDGGLNWTFSNIYSQISFNAISNDLKFDIHSDSISTLIQREDSFWFLNVYTNDYDQPAIDSFTIPEQITLRSFRNYNGQLILISNDERLFSSQDLGQTWSVHSYPQLSSLSDIKYGSEEIYIKVNSQLYGIKYQDLNTINLLFESSLDHSISYTESSVGTLASTSDGIFLRPEEGTPFSFIGEGISGIPTDFKIADDVMWLKTDYWYRSTDEAISWSLSPLEVLDNSQIILTYNGIFILEKENEIFRSTDNGVTWQSIINFQGSVNTIEQENGIFLYDHFSIYFSEDGINFTEMTHLSGDGNFVWYKNQLLYFYENQRYISNDNGLNWEIPEPTG